MFISLPIMANNATNNECKESSLLSISDPFNAADGWDYLLDIDENELEQLTTTRNETDGEIVIGDDAKEESSTIVVAPESSSSSSSPRCSNRKMGSESCDLQSNAITSHFNTFRQEEGHHQCCNSETAIDACQSNGSHYPQYSSSKCNEMNPHSTEQSQTTTKSVNQVVLVTNDCPRTFARARIPNAGGKKNRKKEEGRSSTPNPPHPQIFDDDSSTTPTTTTRILEPTENDVLYGRGARANRHSGNQRYHEEKKRLRPKYRQADKKDKFAIIV